MATRDTRSPMQKIRDAGETPLNEQPGAQRGSSISVAKLAERYGENAKEVYFRIALVAWGDFRNIPSGNLNPLDTTQLSDEQRAALVEVLAEADAEFLKPTEEAKE
jgi:hypothetical protein